jgi:ribulose-phosphate 3-epimerase
MVRSRAVAADYPHGVQVAPSILSADFGRLGAQVQTVLDAGARVIHFDVMDGHFVPPITIGPLVLEGIADQVHAAGGIVDVHLMIEKPAGQIADFASAGADSITFHYEATPHVHYALTKVKEAGCRAGLAINLSTPVEVASLVVDELDLVLCMTINPGWGGQKLVPSSLNKVGQLRSLLPDRIAIEVDGGIDPSTAPRAVSAGARFLVAGSYVFGHDDPAAAFNEIVSAASAA